MTIKLTNTGKRFNRDWIFRYADLAFLPGETYAITGPNGSGKSTLLQVLGGTIAVSEGTIEWQVNGKKLDEEKVHRHLAIAAPYLELIEEMTAIEFLAFHQKFKNPIAGYSIGEILATVGLRQAAEKQIRYYSSGMKQRIKLAQAFFSDVPLLLLDEPVTNLDSAGISLYHQLVDKFAGNRTLVVCSNDEVEYAFCRHVVSILDYKNIAARQ